MPLDVLSKIQSFANGGSVDAGTKGAINQMIGDAQQNPALQSGLNGIANAVTNNGADINPDTMAKLARAGQAFSKAMEQANLAMLGIHGSFNSIDVTPLEKAEASLTGIAEHGKSISINIGTKDAESSLSSIANRLEKIRSSASIGVSVSTSIPRATSAPKAQKFATGGRITYHRQNTETAQTGGIFRHGSSTGDRNMIFANRGEGIITEKAVRQGARQRGMSPESYVQALNHPSTNLARVKKGRSFQYGGGVLDTATPSTFHHSDTQRAFADLMRYLRGDSFHGGQPTGGPGSPTLQQELDAYVNSHFLTSTHAFDPTAREKDVNKVLAQAKSLEADYQERLKSAETGARTGGIAYVSHSLSTFNTGASNMTSPVGTQRTTTAAQRDRLKNASRSAMSNSETIYEGLGELGHTTVEGNLRKVANESMKSLNDLLQKSTSEQLDALDEYLQHHGLAGGIDALRTSLENFEADFSSDAEDAVRRLRGLAYAASHIDNESIAKKYQRAIDNLKENALHELDLGNLTRNAVGRSQTIDIGNNLRRILNSAGLSSEQKASYQDIAMGFESVKKSSKANKVAQYGLEREFGTGADLSNIMEELSEGHGVGGRTYDETLKGVLRVMKMVRAASDSLKESASDVTDAWDKETDAVKKIIKQLPILGGLTDDQIARHAAWIAGLSLVAKGIQKVGATVSDFVTKQADLSAGLTRASQMVDTFSGKANNFDGLRKSLNLTREQAVAFGDAMSQVALKGVHSVDTVAGIAQNLKSALGKVDTTLLKEAVNLINDLPKEQVDVLITGTGTFDDKANLIANLMKDGNLEKSINLMMNGAFGDMEGSIQLDEKDKAVIAAQEEGNKLLDDIKQGLYSIVPKGFATVSVKYAKVIGTVASMATTLWTLYSISKNVASIAMQMTGRGAGGGGLIDAVRGAWTSAHTPTGSVSLRSFGSNLWNSNNQALRGLAAGTGALIGNEVVSLITDQIKKSADKKDKERASEYRQNAALNMSVYGTAAGRYKDERNTDEAKRSAANVAKATASIVGPIAAVGVALSGLTGGMSLLAAAAITAGAALITGATTFVSEISSLKKIGNPYAHVEVRDWWFDTVKEDANAKERKEGMERIYSDLERRFAEEHGVTVDEVKRDNLMLKQMIQLNKHVKAIEMISKGRFTAFEEGTAQGNASLMKKMTQFGGTNSDYMGASMRAFTMFSQAYAKNNKLMNERKMRIVNGSLGDEEKANALNALLDAELKMHEKFINNMMGVIKAFGDLPQVIVHNLKAEMDNAFNNYMSGGFLGGRNIAMIDARENLKNGTQDMMDLFSANGKNNMMIRESAKFLQQRHDEYKAQLDAMQSETGISSDKEALKQLAEIRSRYDSEDGNLVDIAAGYHDLMDFSNRIQNDNINNVGSDMTKIDAVIGQYLPRVDEMIEILRSQLNYAKDPAERKEIEVAIGKLEDVQSKDMNNKQKWTDMNNAMRNIPTVLEHMKNSLDKITPEDNKQIKNIQRFLSLSQTKASLQDPNVYAQKMRTEQSKQFIQKMEELSKRFKDSLESVLKNGAVQMADAIKGALEKSEEFDMFGNGNAVLDTISAGVDSAIEKFDAADKARNLVQESFSMEDGSKFRKELEEGVQKYFEEIEANAKEQSGNEAEKFIADRVDNIYKLLVEEKKNEITQEGNRMLGAGLREIASQLDRGILKKLFGVKSADELSKLSDEEIGRKIGEFETKLAKKYQTENGMSEPDAKNRARQETEKWLSSYYLVAGIASGYEVDQKRLAKVQKMFSERDSSTSEKMAGIDDELKPKLDELNKQKEEQIKANREETEKILNSTKEGREYLKLIFEQAELSNRLLLNPHDEEAKARLKEITEKISEIESTDTFSKLDDDVKTAIKAAATTAANSTRAHKEAMDAQANAKEEYMKALKNIANAVDKAVQCGESLVMIAKAERLQTQQNFENEYGDVGKAIRMSGSVLEAARDAKNAQMSRIPEARQRGMKEINRLYRDELSRAKTEDERIAATRKRNWSIEKLETSLAQTQIRIHKEIVDKIQQAYQPVLDALDRYKEGANIMKDLFETMGAPFEYILDIENNLVAVAKAYAEQQMNILEEMKKSNVDGATLKKQELKTMRAHADAVKAIYGEQRNAIDKLLGSIMGSFTQLEGVFGPDSEFAKVWKVGQGYTQLPSGLIAPSGGSNVDWGSRLLEHLGTSPKQFHGQGFPFGEQFKGIMGYAEGGIANKIDDDTHRNQSAIYNGGRLNGLTNGDRNIIRVNGNEVIATAQQAQRAGGALELMSILRNGTLPKMKDAYEWMKMNVPGFEGGGVAKYTGIRGKATISNNGRIVNTMSAYDAKNASDDAIMLFYGQNVGGSRQVNPERMRLEQQIAMASLGGRRIQGLKYNSATAQMQPTIESTDLSANAYGYGEEDSKMAESSEHTNAILLKILKDTHSIAEVMGVSVDWSEVENLEKALKRIDDYVKNVADDVHASINDPDRIKFFNERINPAFAGKTTGELMEMRDNLVENSINNGTIGDKSIKKQIYDLNNAILYDKLIGNKKKPEGTSQGENQEASKETSLSVDEEILKYVKMIYWAIVGQVSQSLGQSVKELKKSTDAERNLVKENGKSIVDSQKVLVDDATVTAVQVASALLNEPIPPVQTPLPPPAEPVSVKNSPKPPPPSLGGLAKAEASVKEAGGNGGNGIVVPTGPSPVGGKNAAKSPSVASDALPNGKELPAKSAQPKALPQAEKRMTVDDILGQQPEKVKVPVSRGYDKSQFLNEFRDGIRLGGYSGKSLGSGDTLGGKSSDIGSISLSGSKPSSSPLKVGGEFTLPETNSNRLLLPSRGNELPPPPPPSGAKALGAGEAGNASLIKRENAALVRSNRDKNLPAVRSQQEESTGGNTFVGNPVLRNAMLDALAVSPAIWNVYKQATGSDYEKEFYRRTFAGDAVQSAAGIYAVHGPKTFPNLFGNSSIVAGAPISAETSLAPTWMKNLSLFTEDVEAAENALAGKFDFTKFSLRHHPTGLRLPFPSSVKTLEDAYRFASDVAKGRQGDMEAVSRVMSQFEGSMDYSGRQGTGVVESGENLPVKYEGASPKKNVMDGEFTVRNTDDIKPPSKIAQFGNDVGGQFKGMLNQNVGLGGTALTALALLNSVNHGYQNADMIWQYGLNNENFQNLTIGNEAKNVATTMGTSALVGAGINMGMAALGGSLGATTLTAAGLAGGVTALPVSAATYFLSKDAEQARLLNLEQKDFALGTKGAIEEINSYYDNKTSGENKGILDAQREVMLGSARATNIYNDSVEKQWLNHSVWGDIFGSKGSRSKDLIYGDAEYERVGRATADITGMLKGNADERLEGFKKYQAEEADAIQRQIDEAKKQNNPVGELQRRHQHALALSQVESFEDAKNIQQSEMEARMDDMRKLKTHDSLVAARGARSTLDFIDYISGGMDKVHDASEKWMQTEANIQKPTQEALDMAKSMGLSIPQAIDMEYGKAISQALAVYSLKRDENGNYVTGENGKYATDESRLNAFVAEKNRQDLVAQGYTQAEDVVKWGSDLDARQQSLDAKKQELLTNEEAERKRQEEMLRNMQSARGRMGGIPALTIDATEGSGYARHYVYENGRRKQIRNPEADKWIEQQTQRNMAGAKQQLEQEQKALDNERALMESVFASSNVEQMAKDAIASFNEQKSNAFEAWNDAFSGNTASVKQSNEAETVGNGGVDLKMDDGGGIEAQLPQWQWDSIKESVMARSTQGVADAIRNGQDFIVNTDGLNPEEAKAKTDWILSHQRRGVSWDILEQMDKSYAQGDYKLGNLPTVGESAKQSYHQREENAINIGRSQDAVGLADYDPYADSVDFVHEYGHWRATHTDSVKATREKDDTNENRQALWRDNIRRNKDDFQHFLKYTGLTEEQLASAQEDSTSIPGFGNRTGLGVQNLIAQKLYGSDLTKLSTAQKEVTYAMADTLHMVSGGRYGYGHNTSNFTQTGRKRLEEAGIKREDWAFTGIGHAQGTSRSEEYAHANMIKMLGDEDAQEAFRQMFPNASARGNVIARSMPGYSNKNKELTTPVDEQATATKPEPPKPEPEPVKQNDDKIKEAIVDELKQEPKKEKPKKEEFVKQNEDKSGSKQPDSKKNATDKSAKDAMNDSSKTKKDVVNGMSESIYPLIKKDESVIGYLRRIYELMVAVFGANGTATEDVKNEQLDEKPQDYVNDVDESNAIQKNQLSEYGKSTGNIALDIVNDALNQEMAQMSKIKKDDQNGWSAKNNEYNGSDALKKADMLSEVDSFSDAINNSCGTVPIKGTEAVLVNNENGMESSVPSSFAGSYPTPEITGHVTVEVKVHFDSQMFVEETKKAIIELKNKNDAEAMQAINGIVNSANSKPNGK